MSRLSNRILLLLLFGVLLAAPAALHAQGFDASTLQRAMQNGQGGSLYGSNPFEQTDEEGAEGQQQPQDSTKESKEYIERFRREGNDKEIER